MKYEITYETKGESGKVTISGTEGDLCEAIETLRNSGCFNIVSKRIEEYDPCDRCNRQICYGCPYQEEE